ncbi:DNA polymerase Y family protein [Acuticoccus sp. MNP-M23]|uniref:Y-family DNA polymerase n=1 Tax=Acuticoccus sp. MNP-M23 TaxID=3072793 RepID=UPI0028163F02|nr:DNA polymerase Y family protein [Acuticoccus sp. MNP-M23]WMS41614.1 DNA polymerase Y family protein [Acuticoccus sp. MNP-M23]
MVVSKIKGAFLVEAVDALGEANRIAPGTSLSEARALCPEIRVDVADPEADLAALTALGAALERYTPFVGLDRPSGLFLDVTGCAHLFGGEACMLADISERLAGWGIEAAASIADNPSLAWAQARFGPGGVLAAGAGPAAIKDLRVEALRLDVEAAGVLNRLGIKTVGALLAQPRGPLIRRFGPAVARRIDQVSGLEREAISPLSPVAPMLAERRFPEPLISIDGIGATVKTLAGTLCQSLQGRGEGARRFVLHLFHSDGVVRDARIGASEALADPARIAALFAPKLEALSARIETDSGIDLIRLSASETGRTEGIQNDLYGDAAILEGLSSLIDTLSVRLGKHAVQRFVPVDTHDPIEADCRVPAQDMLVPPPWPEACRMREDAAWSAHGEGGRPRRPVTLFSPPEPIEALVSVPDGPPMRFIWRRVYHEVVAAEGPERIAPKWWQSETDRTCDYYAVEDQEGRRFWIFRQGLYGREPQENRWFMHGLFA